MPLEFHFILPRPVPTHDSLSCSRHEFISFLIHRALQTSCKHLNPDTFPSRTSFKLMTRINDGGRANMYTRVTKDQFEIRDGAYIHTPTQAEFSPNPNSEGSILIYTGNIGAKLASGELFAYA